MHFPHRPGNASDTSAPKENNLEPHSGQHGVEGSQGFCSHQGPPPVVQESGTPGPIAHRSTTFSFTVLGSLEVKNPPAIAGDIRDSGLISGSGRSPGGRHGNPLQYFCLENPMDRGAWWAAVHGVTESRQGLAT